MTPAGVVRSEPPFALTELQQSMLLESQLAPRTGGYTLLMHLSLREALDVPRFERALQTTIDRHAVLRTCFYLDVDQAVPKQRVLPESKLVLEQQDLRSLTAFEQQRQFRLLLTRERRKPFNFSEGPPMRYFLLRTSEEEYTYLWVCHHAAMDGRSYMLIALALFETYDDARAGAPLAPIEPPNQRSQFSDYVRWLSAQEWDDATRFWRQQLASLCVTTPLPCDEARQIGADEEEFGVTRCTLSEATSDALALMARAHRTTGNVVVHAAWAILLHGYCGEAEVCFGSTQSCRFSTASLLEPLGLLMNTLPLRLRIEREISVLELLEIVTARQRAWKEFEHTPHSVMRATSGVPAGLPLFESVLVFNIGSFDSSLRNRGSAAWANRSFTLEEQPHAPLMLNVSLSPTLTIELGYFRSRIQDGAAARLLAELQDLIEAMIERPMARIAELAFLQARPLRAIRDVTFWAKRLATMEPLGVPFSRGAISPVAPEWRLDVPVPSELHRGAAAGFGGANLKVLTALLAFLGRVSGEVGGFDVGLRWPEVSTELSVCRAPQLVAEVDLHAAQRALAEQLADLATRGACPDEREQEAARFGAHAARIGERLPVSVQGVSSWAKADASCFAVGLLIQITADGSCRFCSADSVIERPQAETLARLFAAFLQSLADDPLCELRRIPLGGEGDAARRASILENTAHGYPRGSCTHELFIEQAQRRPNAPAVVCQGSMLTYADLNARSAQLAAVLRSRGIGVGALVGIYVERSVDLVIALLGVMRAGAAYVPLDPIYPTARISSMLTDAGVALVLTQVSLEVDARATGFATLAIDHPTDVLVSATALEHSLAGPEDLAYVIYTSGSTGRPKGVEVGHRALTNLLCSMRDEPGFTESDKLLAITTACFDIAGLELFLPLITGGIVEIVTSSVAVDGFALIEQLQKSQPSVMQATPATWRMLIDAGWQGSSKLKVLCGGERLPRDLARELLRRVRAVWNMYGPTETTIWSSVSSVRVDNPITIGRPLANTSFYVLDVLAQVVPVGVPGELYIGGDGVARGYRRQPELTSEKFVEIPLLSAKRLYRTGDKVRCLPEGEIEYLGRADEQIKLNGFRVELGEIEHVLRAHSNVQEAAVDFETSETGSSRLFACLVLKPLAARVVSVAELRQHLRASLPEYMVPARFLTLDRLPLTLNGKLDRKLLRQQQNAAPLGRDDASGPAVASAIEKRVAAVWKHVLQREGAGLDENFFDAGGKSLDLLRLAVHLNNEFGVSVGSVEILSFPTIRGLAQLLSRESSGLLRGPCEASHSATGEQRHARLASLRKRRGGANK